MGSCWAARFWGVGLLGYCQCCWLRSQIQRLAHLLLTLPGLGEHTYTFRTKHQHKCTDILSPNTYNLCKIILLYHYINIMQNVWYHTRMVIWSIFHVYAYNYYGLADYVREMFVWTNWTFLHTWEHLKMVHSFHQHCGKRRKWYVDRKKILDNRACYQTETYD